MSTTTKHLLISITLAAIIFSVMHVIFVRPQSTHDLLLDLRSLLNFLFVYSVGMYFGLKSRGFYEKEKYGKVDQVPFKAKLDLSKDQIIDKLSESVNFVVKKNNDQEVELQSKMSWFSFGDIITIKKVNTQLDSSEWVFVHKPKFAFQLLHFDFPRILINRLLTDLNRA